EGPAHDERSAQAVGNQHDRSRTLHDGLRQPGRPLRIDGMVPIGLLHPPKAGEGLLPRGLPVLVARAPEAGKYEYRELFDVAHAWHPLPGSAVWWMAAQQHGNDGMAPAEVPAAE